MEELMKVTAYGTFGSIPVFVPGRTIGGNTTCYRIDSPCLPSDTWLIADAGSGYVMACIDALRAGAKHLIVLLTHMHHDHQQGLLMGAVTYIPSIRTTLVGPKENGIGPKEMLRTLMAKPYHPRDIALEAAHFNPPVDFEYPQNHVLLFHPEGGFKVLTVDVFEHLCATGRQMPFRRHQQFDLAECLVVKMFKSFHPETTITYRFEEMPTGRKMVFLTDHENQEGTSADLKAHLKGIDLLIQDVQYSRAMYDERCTGFGHGTPDYAVRLCNATGVRRVGFTHHHFAWDDAQILANVETAQRLADQIRSDPKNVDRVEELIAPEGIFLIRDYMVLDV